MPDRPLLIFPTPELASRNKLPPGPSSTHRPPHNRQGERVEPMFSRLREAFEARRIEIQQTAAGVEPEQVLVIEIIGNVENFANAVRKIPGLEWMGEIEVEDISPDEDFYDEKNREKDLSGRLYMVMTNQRALREMLSLWNRYKDDENMPFERGFARFRDVFLHLKDIRPWGIQDRLYETGTIDFWQEDIEGFPDLPIKAEIELWFRNSEGKRQDADRQVTSLIEGIRGQVISRYILNEIAYHSILAEFPLGAIQDIIENPSTELVKCDSIMFFRPVGQMSTGKPPVEDDLVDFEVNEVQELPDGNPVVAILDGLPLANHSLLADRIIIDDPDDFASNYTVADRVHGTAMSSLVVHGDLSNGENPLNRPVYIRPIMNPQYWDNNFQGEIIPENFLVVDLIHRAVRHIFEGDGSTEAAAPNIRIINLSIGDKARQFTQSMSPLARLLDWLSVKYGVIFVISAGNHPDNIDIEIPVDEFTQLENHDKEDIIVKKLYRDARHRRLLSPSESINNISVGALHHDESVFASRPGIIDLYSNSVLPSPISAFGSGYRRSIKPDILFGGGRVLYESVTPTPANTLLKSIDFLRAPGNKVATPSRTPGDLNKTMYCSGTSNSAALVSRSLSICYESLLEIFDEQAPDIEFGNFIAPLLKAMIIHGCSWGEIGNRLNQILRTSDNGHQIRNLISLWLGYGVPDYSKVLDCTEQRISILGFGQLLDEEAHVFSLPLPPSLAAKRIRRRLTVTLAYLSQVASSTQKYRVANLWFDIDGDVTLAATRQDAEHRAVKRGTVHHEIFEDDRAVPINDGDTVTIKVNCRKDAQRIEEPVPYGIVVSLEVAEGVDIPIYNEVRTRIAPVIEIRAGEGI